MTSAGLNFDGHAWVRHRNTTYKVRRPGGPGEFTEEQLTVELESGPDDLDHDEVRSMAMMAYLDDGGPE